MKRIRKPLQMKDIDLGFNEIKPWLQKKLDERQLSVERFSMATDCVVDPTSVWRWYRDETRPRASTMKVVCETLSKVPVILQDGTKYREHVPWSEGLGVYSPKPRALAAHYSKNPSGRPSGKHEHEHSVQKNTRQVGFKH